MDMDGMDMGGMDAPGLFTSENRFRAAVLWYIIAACVAVLGAARLGAYVQARRRRISGNARPIGYLAKYTATASAILRELSYPQPICFNGFSRYFTPPPLGRCLLLLGYWVVILVLLWADVLLNPDDPMYPYRWEKVGFRAAWISISQIPLVYLLSCKFNPISLLTGISYERFNWLHRWTARTVFLTIIVHWSYFFFEWWQADFVEYELQMMPMVKYGFGAWAVIGWMIFSGFGFFRAASYEFFVMQHIFAAATLLWLLYVHVPAYAAYNIWLSVAFLAFDWGARIILGLARNMRLGSVPGYMAQLEPLSDGMLRLTIDNVDFGWASGQHMYISIPSIRLLETHPFTIANNAQTYDGRRRPLTMVIKAHSGFSKSLYRCSLKDSGRKRRVFLSWPLGMPPTLSHYDTVVLIACSTGASFIVPLLQGLILNKGCVRQIRLHWMVKTREQVSWFSEALTEALEAADERNLRLGVYIHVTDLLAVDSADARDLKTPMVDSTSISSESSGKERAPLLESKRPMSISCSGRPSVDSLVRPAVESALGETSIVACGGMAFTAQMRTFVGSLSNERAVHKGTGAQGICLFTETYGW